jgi:hypothetical protein
VEDEVSISQMSQRSAFFIFKDEGVGFIPYFVLKRIQGRCLSEMSRFQYFPVTLF